MGCERQDVAVLPRNYRIEKLKHRQKSEVAAWTSREEWEVWEGHTGKYSGTRRDGEGCGTSRKDDAMRTSLSAGQRVQRAARFVRLASSKAKSEGLQMPV